MPRLFERSLVCFYCGTKSSVKQNRQVRQFQCGNCDATNYLDKNGEITEPPTAGTPHTTIQYAYPPIRAASPPVASQQASDLFCQRCLQNQHIYTEALASHLPDPSDSHYAKYEAGLEEFKADLGKRYPQVCKNCAPRVNQRLREATNVARADHLGRLMDKSRGAGPKKRWRWQHVVVFVGGLMWWSSLLVQVVWHTFGMLPQPDGQKPILSRFWCMIAALHTHEVQANCFDATTDVAKTCLWIAGASLWWNRKLGQKLSSREGRLRGVSDYLILQIFVLVVRMFAIWALQDQDFLPTSIPREAGHGVMLLLLGLTTIKSLTIVKLADKPLVSFTGLKPVTVPEVDEGTLTPRRIHQTTHTETSFPISALSSRRSLSPSDGWATPVSIASTTTTDWTHGESSETAELDDSAMEWTPTQPSHLKELMPRRPIPPTTRQTRSQHLKQQQQPSPFRGTLPPAPIPPSHKVRKPIQPFISASQDRKDEFYERMMKAQDAENLDFGGGKRGDYTLAEPKLRDHEAETRETGLESIFNSAFSLGAPSSSPEGGHEETGNGVFDHRPVGHMDSDDTSKFGTVIKRAVFSLFLAAIAGAVFAWSFDSFGWRES